MRSQLASTYSGVELPAAADRRLALLALRPLSASVSQRMESSNTLFAVVRVRGAAWEPARQMREQRAWREHAAFMNALAANRFIVLGGPLGAGQRVLLIVESDSEATVCSRLALDPWSTMDLLRIESVHPWRVLLDRNSTNQPHAG